MKNIFDTQLAEDLLTIKKEIKLVTKIGKKNIFLKIFLNQKQTQTGKIVLLKKTARLCRRGCQISS